MKGGANDREDVLRRVACGDLVRHDVEVQRLIDQHPEIERELDEIEQLESTLSDLGVRDRALAAEPSDDDRAMVRDFLEPRLGATKPPTQRAVRVLAAVTVALAATVLLILSMRRDSKVSEPTYLGTGIIGEMIAPVGPSASLEHFEWRVTDSSWTGSYVVVVYDDEAKEVARSPQLETEHWNPGDELGAKLANLGEFSWEVTALGRDGTPSGFGSAKASSSEP